MSIGLGKGLWGDEPEWFDAVVLDEGRSKKPNKSASGLAFGDPQSQKAMADLGHMRKAFGKMDYLEVYEPLYILGG